MLYSKYHHISGMEKGSDLRSYCPRKMMFSFQNVIFVTALVTAILQGENSARVAVLAASEDNKVASNESQQLEGNRNLVRKKTDTSSSHDNPYDWFTWTTPTPPSPAPTMGPTTMKPTTMGPTVGPTLRPTTTNPTMNPTMRPTTLCTSAFTIATYDSIDRDIENVKQNIDDDKTRSHFLGGILRLAAHDFMDFDPRQFIPMGPDGCYDEEHSNNAGLERVWCDTCALTVLYRQKYSHLSRADFWIAAANAVIRQTSVDNALDLKDTFRWGRRDRNSCRGSGARLPRPAGCADIEEVFIRRMGLDWEDAVALMGAHTLGGGSRGSSGHDGSWVENNQDSQVFNKQYYLEIANNAWRPRNRGGPQDGGPPQDWTTVRNNNHNNSQMMLNTDICLAFNIDQFLVQSIPCCTRTGGAYSDGEDACIDMDAARRSCPRYSPRDHRRAATDAVYRYAGGTDNSQFYDAFVEAWQKATTVGQTRLYPLTETCELK